MDDCASDIAARAPPKTAIPNIVCNFMAKRTDDRKAILLLYGLPKIGRFLRQPAEAPFFASEFGITMKK